MQSLLHFTLTFYDESLYALVMVESIFLHHSEWKPGLFYLNNLSYPSIRN